MAPLVETVENPVSLFDGEPGDQEEQCFALNDQTPLFPEEEQKGMKADDAGFESWVCHLKSSKPPFSIWEMRVFLPGWALYGKL